MSVSVGPVSTACTRIPRTASSARSDCDSDKAAAFEIEYAGMIGYGASAVIDSEFTMTPRDWRQQRQERLRHAVGAEQIHRKVLLENGAIAEVVVRRDAGVVDENVQRVDLLDGRPDLRGVGHVECEWRDPLVRVRERLPSTGVDAPRTAT